MGIFDKMLDVMKLNDYEDEEYDEEYDDLEDEYEEPERKGLFFKKTGTDDVDEPEEAAEPAQPARLKVKSQGGSSASSKITPIRTRRSGSMEVCVIKPTTFEDSREISETLLANRTVILNVEGLDLQLTQRIIDFVSGSCYAINGNLQRVGNCIFVVTPQAVDLSGDFNELVGAFDLSAIQTAGF